MEKNKLVGNIFKTKRIEEKYSLEDVQYLLKKECNIELDISNISRYEKGTVKNMNPKYIRGLCKIYKLDYIQIFKELEFLEANDLNNSSQDIRVCNLDKLGRLEYNDFMKEAALFFNNESIKDEDKKKLIDALTEIFFDAKLKNKNK